MDSFLDWAWLVLFATITVVRKVHERSIGARRSLSGIPLVEFVLMTAWALLAAVAPFVFLFSDWLAFADYPFEIPGVFGAVGVGLFLAAIWLLHASHRDLGRSWTPRAAPAEAGTLVTNGIYEKLRHPMYAAHILWAIAQTLLLPNFLAGAGAVLPLVLLLWFRIPREERQLTAFYGDEYRAYMRRTGRLWPRRPSGE